MDDRQQWINRVNETAQNITERRIVEQIDEGGLEVNGRGITIRIGLDNDDNVRVEAFINEKAWGKGIDEKMIAEMKVPFSYVASHLEGVTSGMLDRDIGNFLGEIEQRIENGERLDKESELVSERTVWSNVDNNGDDEKTVENKEPDKNAQTSEHTPDKKEQIEAEDIPEDDTKHDDETPGTPKHIDDDPPDNPPSGAVELPESEKQEPAERQNKFGSYGVSEGGDEDWYKDTAYELSK